jgi:hypothetical protein
MAHILNEISLFPEEQSHAIFMKVDGTKDHLAKLNKSDPKRQISCVFSYM